ncbi:GntR family transcriptional regulator [Martelella sp. HB161492]|uniref:FCD domain-containing protein n=1 Tax=Martelella sp. HB161492 TaxID=2720726 RepID=UPI0015911598
MRGKHPVEDLLYDRLVDAIIDEQMCPGQHLNEVRLAERHNVPRSRVRRVLERLRDEDMVVFELNRGAFVCRPTVQDAHDIFEIRRSLEDLAVRLACERARPADIVILRKALPQALASLSASETETGRLAVNFHLALVRICGNESLEMMVAQLIRRCVLVQSVYQKASAVLCPSREFAGIIDCIERKDADAASALMALHFDHIAANLDLDEARGTGDAAHALV